MSVARFAVLISGRGSNLKAIIDHWRKEDRPDQVGRSEPALVIANRPGAPGLRFAEAAEIPTLVIDHTGYESRERFDEALIEALEAHQISWVILAGFMRVLSPGFVARFAGHILNTHPSLLPCFPGRDAVEQALEAGVKISGCTVHLVDDGVDTGRILAQAAVPVARDDDHERLGARIRSAEHHLYPRVIAEILAGEEP